MSNQPNFEGLNWKKNKKKLLESTYQTRVRRLE
jgi:hypothetical protein